VGEIKTGDIIDTVKNPNHFNEERNALTSILDDLPHFFSTKIEHIFDEVSKLSTNEAKFVHAIDKLEAQLWWLGEEAVEEIIKLNLSKGNAPWNSSHNQYLREKKLLQDFGFKKMEEFLDIIFEEK
jgi:5'-deoxynucleotidase YfbR-like HD superfamily hydrolase